MKRWRQIILFSGFISGVALLTGCEDMQDSTLTGKLWTGGPCNYYQAATNAEVKIFERDKHSDVLVEYNEKFEKTGHICRRAYFLMANESRVECGRKPRFVSLSLASGMEPVPVDWIQNVAADNASPKTWVEPSPDGQRFRLFNDGLAEGEYSLPKYRGRPNAAKVLLLTPATLTADTLVAGSIVGLAVGIPAGMSYLGDKLDHDDNDRGKGEKHDHKRERR